MYPGPHPADSISPESVGEIYVAESQQMHDNALKQAVKEVIDEYAVTDAWTQKELKFQIVCPSGQKCLAKRLTTLDMIESGLLDEIDYFTKKLMPEQTDTATDEEGSAHFNKLLKDPIKRARLFDLLDGLLSIGVVRPKVHAVPKSVGIEQYKSWEGSDLPRGEVWANQIDFADKMFIFGELNKPLDEIQTFRLQSETGVADMVTMEGVSGEAK